MKKRRISPKARNRAASQPEGPFWKRLGVIPVTIAVSLFIVCFDNNQFWSIVGDTVSAVEQPRGVLLALFLLLFGAVNVTLALSIGQRGFKLTAAFLLLVASAVGFYMSEFGVAIDTSIIRSVGETDSREAATLLSAALFWKIALFGLLPAAIVLALPMQQTSWRRDIAAKSTLIALSILAPAAAIYANYLEFSFYSQSNRHVRLFMNPVYPVYATGQYFRELFATQTDHSVTLATGIARTKHSSSTKPLVVVLVLGETARADHWSLNGYERDTNRYTASHDAVNFPEVSSCGTSTADSLPCIFSQLPRAGFSHVAAARQENLLSLLRRLSVDVLWVDNSTGCKGLCADGDFVSIAGADDPTFCDAHGCYDELLLRELEHRLAGVAEDTFVVLHERGSHGPTYYQNVPQAAKAFLPECTLDTFRNCDDQSLINAYDNTILYGDLMLAQLMDYLTTLEQTFDVAMLYVSDHGESLGENGIYLHGFPYVLAPANQTEVPMLFWASDGYYTRMEIDHRCLEADAGQPRSHDAIFHTALGLMEARSDDYRDELDLFAHCRRPWLLSMASESALGVASGEIRSLN